MGEMCQHEYAESTPWKTGTILYENISPCVSCWKFINYSDTFAQDEYQYSKSVRILSELPTRQRGCRCNLGKIASYPGKRRISTGRTRCAPKTLIPYYYFHGQNTLLCLVLLTLLVTVTYQILVHEGPQVDK